MRWDLQRANNEASTARGNPLFGDILPDLNYDGAGTEHRVERPLAAGRA